MSLCKSSSHSKCHLKPCFVRSSILIHFFILSCKRIIRYLQSDLCCLFCFWKRPLQCVAATRSNMQTARSTTDAQSPKGISVCVHYLSLLFIAVISLLQRDELKVSQQENQKQNRFKVFSCLSNV